MKLYQFAIVFLALSILSCTKAPEEIALSAQAHQENFDDLLTNYQEGKAWTDPIQATFDGERAFDSIFVNRLTKTYKDSAIAFFTRTQKALNEIPMDSLTGVGRLSYKVLQWECDINLEELSFRKELFPIDQMWSDNLKIGQFASGQSAQPFNTVQDYDNWLKRLDGYVEWLHSAEERMKEGASIRYVLPSSLIIKIVPQLQEMASTDLEEHLFYKPVLSMPAAFSKEDKERLTIAYQEMIGQKVIPAYQKLYDYVSNDYLNAGRNSSGIDALPNGAEYYQFSIKKYTTTEMTAEEIHALGLSEVERILSEMELVKQEIGFEGDLKAFFNHVRQNKDLMPFSEPQEVLDHFVGIHKRMENQLDVLFPMKPQLDFIVKQTEKFREASASAEYNQGSLADGRPGVFYVPIPDASKYNIYSDEALFLHEAIPGHHYQISLAQENDSLPGFRKALWYSSYGEGWALYAESLGKELGLYTDPYQYFGMLGSEMHRAIRLVVDTGIHAKGWTREQAIQYSLDNEAEPEYSIISEIERYMANPGQALSYKIGQLKIIELRNRAQNALGEHFDIGAFHQEILKTGCIPLAILEEEVDAWIQAQKVKHVLDVQ